MQNEEKIQVIFFRGVFLQNQQKRMFSERFAQISRVLAQLHSLLKIRFADETTEVFPFDRVLFQILVFVYFLVKFPTLSIKFTTKGIHCLQPTVKNRDAFYVMHC
jgi:hypothetical protein